MNSLYINISGKGPPLVLLHGWGWDSRIWLPLLPRLIEDYCVYRIDLPGCGKSPLTYPYDLSEIGSKLLAVAPQQATWLGWSLGGLFATWLAAHYPARISQLITVTSSPCFVAQTDWPGLQLDTLRKFSDTLRTHPAATLQQFLNLQLRGSAQQTTVLHLLEQHQATQHPPSQSALEGGLHLLETIDLRSTLSMIKQPNLHLFGQLDTLVPAKLSELLPTLNAQARCEVLPRCGHLPFLTHMDTFLVLLNNFIKV